MMMRDGVLLVAALLLVSCGNTGSGGEMDWGGFGEPLQPEREQRVENGEERPNEEIDGMVDGLEVSGVLSSCSNLEVAWIQEEAIHRLPPAVFALSPDGRMVLEGSDAYNMGWRSYRGDDGGMLWRPDSSSILDHNARWDRFLQRRHVDGEQQLVVTAHPGGEALWSYPGRVVTGALASDDDRLATMRCEREDGGASRTHVEIWDIAGDRRLAQKSFESAGCFWYADAHSVRFLPGSNDRLIFWSYVRDRIHDEQDVARVGFWDLGTDRLEMIALPTGTPRTYHGDIASTRAHPDGRHISTIDHEGTRWIADLASEEPRFEEVEQRGSFIANQDTYMPPLPVSPLIFSEDGKLEASVDPDGRVELRDVEGAQLALLESPIAMPEHWGEDRINPPVAMAFTPEQDGLLVAYRQGLALFSCDGAVPSRETTLPELALEAPAVVRAGESFTLQLEIAPTDAWTVRKLYVQGEMRASSWDDHIAWTFHQAGVQELQIELDDGFSQRRSQRVSIEVLPAAR